MDPKPSDITSQDLIPDYKLDHSDIIAFHNSNIDIPFSTRLESILPSFSPSNSFQYFR